MFSRNSAALASALKATIDLDQRARREPEGRRVEQRVDAAEHRQPGGRRSPRQQQRDRRPGRGDAELLARRLGVAQRAHEAAEEEQVDAADPDPFAARGQRVPELVQHDRAEEDERGDDGADEPLAGGDDRLRRTESCSQ